VVDLGHFPVTLVVTGLAFIAFLALVLVVLLVTGDAGCLQLFLVQESGMTGLALGRDVLAAQDVLRVAVMVESGDLPVLLDMTGVTFLAEPPLVALFVIVRFVAGDTGALEFLLVQEAGVAAVAFGRNMLAAQEVFGIAVVVKNGNAPVFFRVAGLALLAKTTFMAVLVVIGFVTGDAGGLQFFLV
jgi:hypothetical protein